MILAAGKGERMLPLTANTPKPLLEIDGKSLIQHQVEKLASNGINEIVVNYSYLGKQIEQALGSGEQWGVTIQYSSETEPLETAGGIIKALPLLGSDAFIVVNADIWTNYSFQSLPFLSGAESLAHLVMVDNASHHRQGDFVLGSNGLLSCSDAQQAKTITYSGIGVFHPSFFAGIENGKLALRPLLNAAIERHLVSGEYFQGEWVDVGTPERLQSLQSS